VLPLQCYDMILGEDWLEEVSPLWVDYKSKQLGFTYQGTRVSLQGVQDNITSYQSISGHKFQRLLNHGAVYHCIQLLLINHDNDLPTEGHASRVCEIQNIEQHPIPLRIQQLIDSFAHLYNSPTRLPPHRLADHQIPLMSGAQPVKVRSYRYSPTQKTEIKKQLKEMLTQGIIHPSTSPFASPVILVKKKDGSWQFCVDYRHLNVITIKNKHPMPIVDELLDELVGACWFTKLDFSAGYHQVCMAVGEEYKIAFRTHNGMYEFMVMPFGLTNAPATFQGLMDHIFADLLRHGVMVFMDDILIYSHTLHEHELLLQQVFQTLNQHKFFIKRTKCTFAQSSIEYLGHVISAQGVSTEPSKVAAVKNWPIPKNVKQLRGFLGLT
jgi:hypothetical protein